MSMTITFNGSQGTQGTQGNEGSSGGSKAEELQSRFDDIKSQPDGAQKTQDLKDLKKDVDSELKNEESKQGGGNEDMMKALMQLLQMIMQMLQKGQSGAGEEEESETP